MPRGTPSNDKTYGEAICGKPDCEEEFTKTRHNQKYCPEHRTPPNRVRYRYLREAAEKNVLDRRCVRQSCTRKITDPKRVGNVRVKYCSDACAKAAQSEKEKEKRRQASRAKLEERAGKDIPEHVRHGETLRVLEGSGDATRIDAGTLSVRQAAEIHGTTPATISRSMDAWRYTQARRQEKEDWEPSWLVRALLPTHKLLALRELGLSGQEDTDEFNRLADELTRAYSVFSRFFFRLEGNRPIIKDFHLAWIRSIIVAYAVGGKQLILSPPRHGKSEVLIRFAVWFIAMFPNIRIVWVAANTDVAKIMLGAVKDHLTNNEELIAATLPPGEAYRPTPAQGRPWSGKEIKVRQQTHVGAKSSSMLALGATSKILSRDVDILIVDDLEDFDSTQEPGQRKKTKAKFAEYGTRKEEKTAWIDIGSRQHPDDVAGSLLKGSGTDQGWRIIVNTAHEDCDLDPEITEGHDGNGCVLFPEVRNYRWLMEKKAEMDVLGIAGAYEMRYLNRPMPTEGIVFDVPLIRERALDHSRDVGIEALPPGQLIAGIDPSSRATQAAFGWHFQMLEDEDEGPFPSLSMIDLETQEAGGIAGALRLIEDWHARYQIYDYVYEDNSQQIEFFNDPRVHELRNRLGINIFPHTTGKNKADPEYGLSAMAPWCHNGTISLPYATPEARSKVNQWLAQLELWTTDGMAKGRNRKSDIKMASWLPFPRIVRWARKGRYQEKMNRMGQSSYPGFHARASVAWSTQYPKG